MGCRIQLLHCNLYVMMATADENGIQNIQRAGGEQYIKRVVFIYIYI